MPAKKEFKPPSSRQDNSYAAALERWKKGPQVGVRLVPQSKEQAAKQLQKERAITAKFNSKLRNDAAKPAPGKHEFDSAILKAHESIPAKKGIKSLNDLRVLVEEKTGIVNQTVIGIRLSVLARAGLLPKVKTLKYHKHFVAPKPKEALPLKVPVIDKVVLLQSPYMREFKLFGSSNLIKAVAEEMKKDPLLRSQRKIDEIIAVIAEIAPPKNKIQSLQIIAGLMKGKKN